MKRYAVSKNPSLKDQMRVLTIKEEKLLTDQVLHELFQSRYTSFALRILIEIIVSEENLNQKLIQFQLDFSTHIKVSHTPIYSSVKCSIEFHRQWARVMMLSSITIQ